MSNLKWTPLRHTVLRAVAAGEMEIYVGMQYSLIFKATPDRPRRWLVGAQRRVSTDLREMVTTRRAAHEDFVDAVLTREGRELLRQWDKDHPGGAA